MTGVPLIIAFVVAVVAMILLISKCRAHPFLVIMGISLLLAIIAGIPLKDIPQVIGTGFSSTFTSIGIVIILGAFIGAVLEKTGAAFKLADIVIGIVGHRRPALAMELMGWVVSVPVFCDSGFVILDPVRNAIIKKTGASSVAMTMCLACGLYVSHVFIPPTPGPIAAALSMGVGESLLLVIGLGILCSVFPLAAGYIYAGIVCKKVKSADEASRGDDWSVQSYEELKASYGRLPSSASSLAPLFTPLVLMALSSTTSMLKWSGALAEITVFLGTPIMALAVGVVLAIALLFASKKGNIFFEITNDTLKTIGPILFITAAGGVLGKVIASSGMVDYITEHAQVMQTLGLFFPFLLAAILKSAQGSSTVAITTTAGIVAPLLPSLGLTTPVDISLAVMAIGAGGMTVSHANDSYFWVVTNLGQMKTEDGYRTQTIMTLVMGLSSIAGIFLLSIIL